MNNIWQQNNIIFPKWLNNPAVLVYVLALLVVTALYSSYSLPWYYMLSGVVFVLVFFLGAQRLTKSWSVWNIPKTKKFEQNLFGMAFLLRVAWVLIIYWIFQVNYGDAFGFEDADATFYHDLGEFSANLFRQGDFAIRADIEQWAPKTDISDMGYGYYVGLVYALTGDSIIIVRLLKCIWSALTCVLIYRLGVRNFGEETGRLAAIFCMLWPNFWYYCGSHLKEVEMVFLGMLFIDQADQMLKARNFTVWKIVPILLISGALFTIRTPLAIVTILCLLFSVVMSSSKVVGWTKRIAVGILALLLIGVTMGNSIQEQTSDLLEQSKTNQDQGLDYKAKRKNGNHFAKYAGKTVFAPLIFTIPFPTMVGANKEQNTQMLLNGGNYIKNIVSFFTILVLFVLLFSGRWRRHIVPLSYMLGYLVVLAMSNFAHAERFHQPAMPMELMFAAYGVSQVLQGVPIVKGIGSRKIYRTWFTIWLGAMFIAAIAWNWFKLAGRGLV